MQRFFAAIVRHPIAVVLCGLAAILFFGLQALDLRKDARAEAFHPPDHPAVVDRERLIETFGLTDPIIVAVHRQGADGIYTALTLTLVYELTERLRGVPGVDPERVTSLATEKSIVGDDFGLIVEPFVAGPVTSTEQAQATKAAVDATPSLAGRLVSQDGAVTLVIADLLKDADAEAAYWATLAIVEAIKPPNGESLHVAGAGAMLGYLGTYMDRDARTLAPFAVVLVILSLFLAHRSAIGVLVPSLVIAASVAITLGTMSLLGARFYVITNALPVILIGIAVDDALHIFGEYKRRLALDLQGDKRQRIVETMTAMFQPVSVTTLTTAAGCLALGFSSAIPPMREFGLYAAFGIGLAWLASLTLVPAFIALWPRPVGPVPSATQGISVEGDDRITGSLRRLVFARPRSIVTVCSVWLVLGLVAAASLRIDEANIDNFQREEPIVLADRLINDHGIGSNYIDVMIEGRRADDLLRAEVLQYVERLQSHAWTIPGVLHGVSYLDSLKQIDGALREPGDDAPDVLRSEDMAAQYLLLYSMSGDPADFRRMLTNSYQSANLRLFLDSGWFSDETETLAALRDYLAENPAPDGITATLSGIAVVHVSWVGMLFEGHLTSILISLLVVWLIATLSFQSPLRGSLVMVPVIFAVLTVYAAMASTGVNLGVGTSMTAAIAIGLSIDFGVHLLHRLDTHLRDGLAPLREAVGKAIRDSGRAIFFGFLTGFLGFGVLIMSQAPGVERFGALVALSLAASFLASLVLLPALILTSKTLAARLRRSVRQAHPAAPLQNRSAGEEICSSAHPSAR